MPSLIDVIFRRVPEAPEAPEIPVCPDHKREMHLRGKQGKPSRFANQSEEEYTFIYYCPVEECNETDTRVRVRTQIPVPGEAPERPTFSRPGEQKSL